MKLETFNHRINIFNAVLKRDKLPSYLMPGETLLGKYQIEQVVTYRRIITENLRANLTVFPAKVAREQNINETMSMASGRTGKTGKTLRRAKLPHKEGSGASALGKSAFSSAGGHRRSLHQHS